MQSGATPDRPTTAPLASPATPSSSSQHGSVSSTVFGGAPDLRPDGRGPTAFGDVRNSPAPGTSKSDRADRIAQYEAMAVLPSYGGGSLDAGFIVSKTNWAGKAPKDSPIARFPNGMQ